MQAFQAPKDAAELSGDTGPHNKTGDAPPALHSQEASDGPITRTRVEGKRGPTNPPMRPRHHVVGERPATDKRQSSVNGAGKRSLHTAPPPHNQLGRGRKRKGNQCLGKLAILAASTGHYVNLLPRARREGRGSPSNGANDKPLPRRARL